MAGKAKGGTGKGKAQAGMRYVVEASSALDEELPPILTEEYASKAEALARLDGLDDETLVACCRSAKVDAASYAPVLVLASCMYPADKGMRADLFGSRLMLE